MNEDVIIEIGVPTPEKTLHRGVRSSYRVRMIPREEGFLSLGLSGVRRSPAFGHLCIRHAAGLGLGSEYMAVVELLECCSLVSGEVLPLGVVTPEGECHCWRARVDTWTRHRVGQEYVWKAYLTLDRHLFQEIRS
jgi:hypothetical protein